MFVDHLQLADFRSYLQVDVPLGSGVTTFVGANGQGKTNLVEAVEYVSTLSSHRVSSEVPLVRFGAERAVGLPSGTTRVIVNAVDLAGNASIPAEWRAPQ